MTFQLPAHHLFQLLLLTSSIFQHFLASCSQESEQISKTLSLEIPACRQGTDSAPSTCRKPLVISIHPYEAQWSCPTALSRPWLRHRLQLVSQRGLPHLLLHASPTINLNQTQPNWDERQEAGRCTQGVPCPAPGSPPRPKFHRVSWPAKIFQSNVEQACGGLWRP